MTISTTIIKNSYSGNGSTSVFNYTFKISLESEMEVIIRSSNGTETVKTLTTHYTVGGVGNAGGGTVTFTAGNIPVTGETVILRRDTAQTQTMDLIDNDPMSAETIEDAHDKSIALIQELQEEIDRSIKLSRTNTMTSTEFTVDATNRANKILAFDDNGEISVTQELGTFRGTDATTTTEAYNVRDLVKSTTAAQLNNVYICVADSVVGDLLTDTDHFALIVDAVSASTSATAAATSATAAASSAAAALTSENNSATSETNSANSATASANSATSSASSATASANSATASAASASAAEATFDLFDDSYLGAKASNPSVDNDGDALQDGALYFDTTNNVMKVYDLGSTTWFQLTPTVSNQNNINTLAAISSDVTQAASDSADIQTVASDSADIRALADIEDGTTATNAVSNAGNNATSIVTVAGQISPTNNISSVAAIAADITSVANIDSDVTAVANDATDIGTVATNLTGTNTIGTVAGSIANVNNVGGSIANVNTVATNIASVNNFGEVYRISATAPTTSLDAGDLYFDTATDTLKVYGSSGWQNAGSSVNGTSQRYNYTATSGQTTFTGADNNGNTLTYDAGYIDVYLNGVKLLNGTDVTVTSGSSVVLASGATAGDIVDIVAYGTFSVASLNADNLDSGTVPTARISGAYTGITQTGTLTSFTSTGIDDNATSTAITIDSGETSTLQCSAGDSNFALLAYHPTSTATRTIAKFQSNVGGTQEDKVVIQTSGNVGIGTSSPSSKLEVVGDISAPKTSTNSETRTLLLGGARNGGGNAFAKIDFQQYDDSGSSVDFIGASIRAFEDASDDAGISFHTSSNTTLFTALLIDRSRRLRHLGTSNGNGALNLVGEAVASYKCISFERTNGGGEKGSIVANTSSTSYNTSSDYRLKENVSYDFDATTRLKQLKPARFNFISDADTTVDGFLAHEVSDIVPEAITGEKDAMTTEEYEVTPAVLDENGNVITEAVMGTREVPDYQGIDQSKLVPLLVKTIQELEARITALENA
jgi:hypothetical protein